MTGFLTHLATAAFVAATSVSYHHSTQNNHPSRDQNQRVLLVHHGPRASPGHQLETCGRRQPARAELTCASQSRRYHRTTIRWIRTNRERTLQAVNTGQLWRNRLRFHQWRIRVDTRLIQEATRRLQPSIGHLQLWLCIHRGEGSWTDTGDPYWGGLQMHPGWGYGTSYHASDNTPAEQMQAAERAYRASRYSTSWLTGQWPNTSPPCLRYA